MNTNDKNKKKFETDSMSRDSVKKSGFPSSDDLSGDAGAINVDQDINRSMPGTAGSKVVRDDVSRKGSDTARGR